ncbi:hypothetical protein PAXRUDRAFT_21985 [Paxillus rubicundulus Ve08.2h10]|uniref:Uncharacterized protein n=1 Tax=Paxillus rubicundulus Ve08.2h10 TaxID=930991 RepID=A0A0D0CA76_9AGAM|nr:hypothetical protein PAXRUDRAFT_21985 [Paxillus rubicundulus Ve08.2h10]
MARTKQTAKKTTGGMGPSQQLAQKHRNLQTMTVTKAVGTAKQRLRHKAKASGGQAPQMRLSDDDQPMAVDEDIEAMLQWSSSLPPMTPSPVQGSSALPPASADDPKNDGMDLQGSPPQAIADYLWPYFQPGDL